ncbi:MULTISPECIES: spondin domain-containing protein [Aliagarivorans]|uniref:spondin domain-containing protein n=1 Tax=Aliagarivorans TaxID=882379 RepID=UPI0004174912|nr:MULTISPECIES: spondin domain-containing protein [Aliagarivorans]
MKRTLAALPLIAVAGFTHAATIDVTVSNLTQAITFTPLLVTAHSSDSYLFRLGESASPELQAMAEGGDISGLNTLADSIGAYSVANPAEGLLMANGSTMISDWDTGENTQLTIVAMLLPTNDGFVGLDSWSIPETPGTYTLYLNGYDAGTEANDEIINGGGASGVPGIPANPSGMGGENATGVIATEVNDRVHIHPGNVGDTDPDGGISDVNSRVHRWLNPVAKVVVVVK